MGKLTKMKIVAFEHPDFSVKVGEYDVLVNPENYKVKNEQEFSSSTPIGSSAKTEKYKEGGPGSFEMVLFFDGTGIVSKEKVEKQIKKVKDLVYKFNGDIHEPNYIRLYFGTQSLFEGRLKSWNLNYTMLHMDGSPLRAEVTVVLVKAISAKSEALEEKKNSSDLTHLRTVGDGDTLPLMCYRIYGDVSYYLGVAKYNGLANIRDLKPGQKISFPPAYNLEQGPVPECIIIDEDIEKHIHIILNTIPGERMWHPEFGCGIRNFVFDSFDATHISMMKDSVYDALHYNEPRIKDIKIEIEQNNLSKDSLQNGIVPIHIKYRVISTNARNYMVYQFFAKEGTNL